MNKGLLNIGLLHRGALRRRSGPGVVAEGRHPILSPEVQRADVSTVVIVLSQWDVQQESPTSPSTEVSGILFNDYERGIKVEFYLFIGRWIIYLSNPERNCTAYEGLCFTA